MKNIAEELRTVAENAAQIVGQDPMPGDWIVIISGTIGDDKTTTLRWEWFWRPPSGRTVDLGPRKIGSEPTAPSHGPLPVGGATPKTPPMDHGVG